MLFHCRVQNGGAPNEKSREKKRIHEQQKKINVFNYILSMWIMCLEASLDKRMVIATNIVKRFPTTNKFIAFYCELAWCQ